MTLRELVRIGVRPRRSWLGAAPLFMALAAAGCGHSRQSYRPIYAAPSAVSSPCTNCGSSSAVTAPAESSLAPISSAVTAPASGTIDSTVPTLADPARPRTGTSRGSVLESTPKASIGGEPELDDFPVPATSQRTNPKASPSSKSNSYQNPALTPPQVPAPAAWNTDSSALPAAGVATSKLVRRTSVTERLRPFVDESNAKALMYPDKADRPWKYVVLHHSATTQGSYDQIDAEHRKVLGLDGCGYHFVIGNGTGSGDGQIEIARRWATQKQGLHCRDARSHDADEYGIGICLVGDFDQTPPTPRQIEAAQALVAYLKDRYRISQNRVLTHSALAANPTACPGKFFPTESILPATRGAAQPRNLRTTWRAVREQGKAY